MNSGEYVYIWQQQDWPHWRYEAQRLMGLLGQVHRAQGNLLGRMQTLGLGLREQATLQVLTEDVVKTCSVACSRSPSPKVCIRPNRLPCAR